MFLIKLTFVLRDNVCIIYRRGLNRHRITRGDLQEKIAEMLPNYV